MEVRQRPLGRERLGAPIKPPQGAYLSRAGTERCGKGIDVCIIDGLYQVSFKEMNIVNHC